MRRAKLVFVNQPDGQVILGGSVKLLDADSGEEIECIGDITVSCPLDGVVMANVAVQISEVEIISASNG